MSATVSNPKLQHFQSVDYAKKEFRRHDQQEVIVTVRIGVTGSHRTEEANTLGVVRFHQAGTASASAGSSTAGLLKTALRSTGSLFTGLHNPHKGNLDFQRRRGKHANRCREIEYGGRRSEYRQ
jgi:hypothetical protein